MRTGFNKQHRIDTVFGGGGHVVILGAGASIAATRRDPLRNGKILPSMDTFIDVLELHDIVARLPVHLQATNFETLYSQLHVEEPSSSILTEIEQRVRIYFSDMRLPDTPTIYDYLVLALRPKDVIATFNWDPFLWQAWSRNREIGDPPYIAFLHGNVSIGYNKKLKQAGPAGMRLKKTMDYFEPTRLLYPVAQKNYNDDPFIKSQWDMLNSFLEDKKVARLTIFGYGAPASDIEAVAIMNKAWGTGKRRSDEQVEIIDVRPEHEV